MFLLLPSAVLAETASPSPSDPGGGIVPTDSRATIPDPLGGRSLNEIVVSIINVAYAVASLVALGYLIYGGYSYITSSGNPDASAAARTTISNAIIGLIIVLVSYLIIHFILTALGAEGLLPHTS